MKPGLVEKLNQLDLVTLGSRIKAARLAAGLTQPALGREDASITLISRIESGQRRPSPALIDIMCERMGVTADELVLGYPALADQRRIELALDFAELQLVGGSAQQALTEVDALLASGPLGRVLRHRADYVRASALDTLGDAEAVPAMRKLLAETTDQTLLLRVATALSRILRERGDLVGSINVAKEALEVVGPELLEGAEEAVRLSVTLAAALFEIGDVAQATDLCASAIVEADRLQSPSARGSAYWNASIIEAEAGRLDRALHLAHRSLVLFESGDDVRALGNLRIQFSTLLLREDPPRVEEALAQLGRAEQEMAWSGATSVQSVRHELVSARASFLAGDTETARHRAEQAVARSADHPLIAVSALTLLGQMDWTHNDLLGAQTHYRHAIAVLTGIGSDREAGQLWMDLGALLDDADLTPEARDAYRRAATCLGLTPRLPAMRASALLHS